MILVFPATVIVRAVWTMIPVLNVWLLMLAQVFMEDAHANMATLIILRLIQKNLAMSVRLIARVVQDLKTTAYHVNLD